MKKTYSESLNDLKAAWLNLIMEIIKIFKKEENNE